MTTPSADATAENQPSTVDPVNVDPMSNEKIAALLTKTGYTLVQENGQRWSLSSVKI